MKRTMLTFNTLEYDADQIAEMLQGKWDRVISLQPQISSKTDCYESVAIADRLVYVFWTQTTKTEPIERLPTYDTHDDGGSVLIVIAELTDDEIAALRTSEAYRNSDLWIDNDNDTPGARSL